MALDPQRLGRVAGMLDVLALMATEAAGTLGFEFSIHTLGGDPIEAAYQAYVSTGPCFNGTPWKTHPLQWCPSSWPGLRWTLSEWSRGETPGLPAARAGTPLPPLPEPTPSRDALTLCAEDAAAAACNALVELVGADAEVGLFAVEHDDRRTWRVRLGRHTASVDCILRGHAGSVVLTLGCDD